MQIQSLAIAVLAFAPVFSNHAEAASRTFGREQANLVLGGQTVPLQDFEGGTLRGEVVEHANGTSKVTDKTLVAVRPESLILEMGLLSEKGFGESVRQFLQVNGTYVNGSVQSCDAMSAQMTQTLEFKDALINLVRFPELTAAGKTPGTLTVGLSPSITTVRYGGGSQKCQADPNKRKPWMLSNFAVDLDGTRLNAVSKVSAFEVTQGISESSVGRDRRGDRQIGKFSVGDLTLFVGQQSLEPLNKWYEEFVVRGNNGNAQEKTITLTYLGQDLKEELARVKLSGVGIKALSRDFSADTNDRIVRYKAEFYVETAEVSWGKQ